MFFERRTQSSIKHRRLRYLLLLSLRLAVLLLLALAFANPFINRSAASMASDKLLLLVIDDSFSMRAGTRLADAKREALAVLDSRSPSERAQVMALGSQLAGADRSPRRIPASCAPPSKASRPAIRAPVSASSRARLRSMAESVRTPIELHLFSDMQKSAMPASFRGDGAAARTSRWCCIRVVKDAVRTGRSKASMRRARSGIPKKARVQAVVAGYHTPAATRTVSLVVNGKTIATRSVAVPANGRASVEFERSTCPTASAAARCSIDSADALPADDVSLFAVERSDPRRVLFVHEPADTRSPLYFSSALASAAEAAFTMDTISVEQTGNADPVAVRFRRAFRRALAARVLREAACRATCGAAAAFWSPPGTSAARRPRVPVFDDNILESRNYSQRGAALPDGGRRRSLVSLGGEGRTLGGREILLRGARGSRQFAGDQPAHRPDPLLLEKKIGEGRVLLLASGLDNLTNDFPLHPVFVPFVEQTARYLSGIGEPQRLARGRFVSRIAHRQGAGRQRRSHRSGRRGPLSLKEATTAQTYQLTSAGFYQLRLANGRQDLIGVNPDRRESDLDVIPDDVLALWRGNAHAQPAASRRGRSQPDRVPDKALQPLVVRHAAGSDRRRLRNPLFASQYLGTQREDP